ncbi:MAG: hypothetical protein ACFE0J_11705 [Elainellaceae cyanobacterium]
MPSLFHQAIALEISQDVSLVALNRDAAVRNGDRLLSLIGAIAL